LFSVFLLIRFSYTASFNYMFRL